MPHRMSYNLEPVDKIPNQSSFAFLPLHNMASTVPANVSTPPQTIPSLPKLDNTLGALLLGTFFSMMCVMLSRPYPSLILADKLIARSYQTIWYPAPADIYLFPLVSHRLSDHQILCE